MSRRRFLQLAAEAGLSIAGLPSGPALAQTRAPSPAAPATPGTIPDAVVAFPGPWQFHLPRGAIILVSDQQLEDLADPDREIDLSLSATPNRTTLRRLCEQQRAAGARTLILAFDEFWSQYRPGQGGKPRELTPDTDAYVERLARIGGFVRLYGLGLELSLLSPLEIGKGWTRRTGEPGRWVQYREGWRDPATGRYRVALWEQRRWTNNKGTVELQPAGVRVFAFREHRVGRTSCYAVDPAGIVELREAPELERAEPAGPSARHRRLTVSGRGETGVGALDRVLVVVAYTVPEMDYFSPKALPFLEDLVRRYHGAGVPLNGTYADEMHIQQDWGYADHHEEGQFALRYLTPNLARRFAELHGAEFADLEKHLVYFCYGQHGFLSNLDARLPAQHVIGSTPEAIQRTWLLRRRYYDLLDRTVIDLFATAKASAEKLYGHELEARAHATWAQSPTIDFWRTGNAPQAPRQYEYTSDFLWSNTVQQAASACSDYFRWNAFLTGGGNDHAEGGWSDRNYYGLALACSTGILNRTPNAYAAAWGMPAAALRRHRALEHAYGCAPDPAFAAVQDFQHRDTEVLMLYPLSLVAAEERFGSWMVQYGYANYVTPDVLVDRGRVTDDGVIEMAGRRFSTVAVLFEPLPPAGLLPFLEAFVSRGGRLVWSGPPPQFDLAGTAVLARWQALCGIAPGPAPHEGQVAAGGRIEFEGPLARVAPQMILTDFLPDLLHPIQPGPETTVVARAARQVVGIHRKDGAGSVTTLGFRPRDDQAASLGYEVGTWFELLHALGAYPPTAPGLAASDHPVVVSRTRPWLATRFPNGALCLAAHYRSHVEGWPGGFHRDAKQDDEILRRNPLPPDSLDIQDLLLAGHRITYHGTLIACFRLTPDGRLGAFAGHGADRILVDGREHRFADQPPEFAAWAPVRADRRVPGGAVMEIWVNGSTRLSLPLAEPMATSRLHRAGPKPGSIGEAVPSRIEDGSLVFEAGPGAAQGHLLLLPG